MLLAFLIPFVALPADPPTIVVNRDNIEITRSCRVRIARSPIIDADGDGVVHITASDISVEFVADSPLLHGAKDGQSPDSFKGKGIVITGRNVLLSGAKVSGYKVGIHAIKADGSTILDADVSGNYAQRLKSTARAEDASDWLFPHANDENQWITQHGAGLCVEDSRDVTIDGVRARRTQNGIVLDSVNESRIFDCDCSFLSGWGLAMWRSSGNLVSRNAFDFCVRGYSHGVYNRGQDSAGILMFEQCSDNAFIENSATHGGDGFFGFAGKEALGEANARRNTASYKHVGSNNNLFVGNDFSFAAAHGLELTFSFRNRIHSNLFRGNAICGIWGGYSQATIIDRNTFASNGEGAYGLERGGINIEHGRYNQIIANTFEGDACGVHLWWDDDAGLLQTPWGKVNEPFSSNNSIIGNTFKATPLAVQLRQTTLTTLAGNTHDRVAKPLDADESSARDVSDHAAAGASDVRPPQFEALGENRPVGARAELAGRENIVMTEWGPWDHASPLLQFVQRVDGADEYRVLDPAGGQPARDLFTIKGDAELAVEGDRILVRSSKADTLVPYELTFRADSESAPLTVKGLLTGGQWTVKTFASPCDPREDVKRWRAGVEQPDTHTLTCDPLDLAFGNGGLSEARDLPVKLWRDGFGCIATRTLTMPAGRWSITTTSDDGVRVWMDDRVVIDDWTWHAPKRQSHEFTLREPRTIEWRVEYFELDGFATLAVEIAPAR